VTVRRRVIILAVGEGRLAPMEIDGIALRLIINQSREENTMMAAKPSAPAPLYICSS
jgi:hypothetical protein